MARNKILGLLISIIEEYIVKAPFNSLSSLLQKFKINNLNLKYIINNIPEVPITTYTI
jgi:hypothetical protein